MAANHSKVELQLNVPTSKDIAPPDSSRPHRVERRGVAEGMDARSYVHDMDGMVAF